MRKLLFILPALLLFACNKEVALDVSPRETAAPDYNLLSEAILNLEYDRNANKYTAPITLYLRPFENVSNLDDVTLQFNSNRFASYVIKNDTLFNGDKINVKYGDFNKYLLTFKYLSELQGQHTVTVETTIRTVKKTTTINLQTK